MSFQVDCSIPADHPSLPGHFPDTPIVPGVVLLEQVLRALEAWQGERAVVGIPSLKFLRPLLPEQRFSIHLQANVEGCISFECRRAVSVVAKGELELARP